MAITQVKPSKKHIDLKLPAIREAEGQKPQEVPNGNNPSNAPVHK